MRLRFSRAVILASVFIGLVLNGSAQAAEKEVAVVVKIGGIPWFNAMEKGIQKAGKDDALNAYMVGPTTADPAQQVRAVEDLIAKKVNLIAVVPNDAKALEPVFERAKEAGIPVITHESPGQKGALWDIELIDNKEYGELHMKRLAQAMGEEGEYIVYVGSLTVPLHNLWADAAIAYQKEHYPKMKLVADRFGVAESVDDSYRTAVDMMIAHPNLKGILTFGSLGPIGAGRAIKEKGKVGKIALVGGFSPSQGQRLVKEGVILEGYIWNPEQAGEAIINVAKLVMDGTPITDGMEIKGLGKATVNPETHVIKVIKYQALNKSTIDQLVAMGL
ncbi:MAG: autoinducer 2 ABC transporter substrate-binding protein [Verrucomicrobia bacterium]|nr:autoinducer 2 ABC transporter substrate-binding protein [Verrucomicrobiota bacterium]MBV9673077.1 autoinducer 2 ABC transporter substrate-binding protein [Verrucomicrobiota bacterium]